MGYASLLAKEVCHELQSHLFGRLVRALSGWVDFRQQGLNLGLSNTAKRANSGSQDESRSVKICMWLIEGTTHLRTYCFYLRHSDVSELLFPREVKARVVGDIRSQFRAICDFKGTA